MAQSIIQQINTLQRRYNDKMIEYDEAMSEHMANVQQYKLICNTSKFTHCAKENEECKVRGQKTVRYGPVEDPIKPTNSSYAYKNTSTNIICNNETFGDPAPGVEKTCTMQDMCVTPNEIQTSNLDVSKGLVDQKIVELREINDMILEKIKELLKFRDDWTEDYSNQETYLLNKMEQVNMQREQLEKISLPVSHSVVGQYEDSSQQISQLITQYSLLGGALTLTGIAFYLLFRKEGGTSGIQSRPMGSFRLPITN